LIARSELLLVVSHIYAVSVSVLWVGLEESNNTVKLYFRLLPVVSDWVDSLIGPSELLLVVSHLYAVSVSVLLVELENKLVPN